jgi:hypothetical protein
MAGSAVDVPGCIVEITNAVLFSSFDSPIKSPLATGSSNVFDRIRETKKLTN